MSDLTTTQLAERLGVTRQHVLSLLNSGAIPGKQLANGAWLISSDAVARYEIATKRGKGRSLDTNTAWGLLWELSGLRADWLTNSTRARVRRRIRESTAEDLVTAAARRTTAHHYIAANAQRASAGLIATARAAAHSLGTGLIDDRSQVSGYVRSGTPDDYAASHFMVPDITGHDVIYENSLPVAFDGDAMPPAVVAADLATSTDTRERAAALQAIDTMRQEWLAAH